ncbi:BCSC C-terminal domain-containing protein [Variovorax sp. PAMC28562]|nr:BCSC C-terminal domain-containing protein [Variovorax sp. PAMC28562]
MSFRTTDMKTPLHAPFALSPTSVRQRAPARQWIVRLGLLGTLCAGAGAGGPAFAQSDARSALIEQGNYWQSLGRAELAEESWTKLLRVDPKSADAMYGMAQVELTRGNAEAARSWITQLQTAHPTDARVARLQQQARQPGAPAGDLQRARAAAQAGRAAEAVQLYRALFGNRPPPTPLALEFYGVLGGTPQGYDEARKGVAQLIESQQGNLNARLALAQLDTYREPNRRDGIKQLADLSKQPSVAARARASWRQALLWLDARAADAPLYRDYLADQPDPAVSARLGTLAEARTASTASPAAKALSEGFKALDRGDNALAQQRFRQALRAQPGALDALGGLGLVRLKQERFAEAEQLLRQASKAPNGGKWASALRSASYWTLIRQATATRDRNDTTAARSLLERAVKLDAREPVGQNALADLRLAAGPFSDAGQGTRVRVEQARAQARAQVEAGDNAGAQRTLEDAMLIAPDSPWVRFDLASIYRRNGLMAQARDLMDGLLLSQPDKPDALYASALFASDAGDPASGLQYLDRIPANARTRDMSALQNRLWAQGQADALRDAGNLEAERSATLSVGTSFRTRAGEAGMSRLSDREIPIEARIPVGNGKIVLGATPTFLDAGTLSPAFGAAGRFGAGPAAALAQLQGTAPAVGSQTASGVGLSLGYEGKNLSASIGTTPLGFSETNVIGNVSYAGQLSDNVSLKGELSRRAVTDSLLSFAGAKDARTGEKFGGVVATGGRLDLTRDNGTYGFYGYGSYHALTGTNVQNNDRAELGGGIYVHLMKSATSSLTAGMNIDLLHYGKNLSYYTFGQGGYFSPQRYMSVAFPIDWTGQYDRLSWRLNASLGVQSFTQNDSPYFPTDPTRQSDAARATAVATALGVNSAPFTGSYLESSKTGLAYNLAGLLEYQLAPQVYLGGLLSFNNAQNYRQVTGGVYLRYVFGGSSEAGRSRNGGATLRPLSSPYTPLL